MKIPTDDLKDGSAIQLDESVFYCKECKPKHAPQKTEEKPAVLDKVSSPAAKAAGGEKVEKAEKKLARPGSSRRLLARRPSARIGRIAGGARKLPPAITASGETLLEDEPTKKEISPEARKKKAEDREKAREKRLAKPSKADKTEAAEKPADAVAEGEAPKKKKKKKKHKDTEAAKDAPKDGASGKLDSLEILASDSPPPEAKKKKKKKKKKHADAEAAGETRPPGKPGGDSEPAASEPVASEPSAAAVAESEPSKSEKLEKAEKKEEKRRDESEPSESEPSESEVSEEEREAAKKKTLVKAPLISRDKDKAKPEKEVDPEDETAEMLDKPRARPIAKGKTTKLDRDRAFKKRDAEEEEDEREARKRAKPPIVAIGAIGVLVVVLIAILIAVMNSGSPTTKTGGEEKKPEVANVGPDPKVALDAAVAFAKNANDEQFGDAIARLEAVREGAPSDAIRDEATKQLDDLKSRMNDAAGTKYSECEGKAQTSESAGDFDAAIAAIEEFPLALRSSEVWQKNAKSKLEELVLKKLAKAEGEPLLAEAKKLFEEKKDAERAIGLLASFPEDCAKRERETAKKIKFEIGRMANLSILIAKGAKEQAEKEAELAKKAREREDAKKARAALMSAAEDAKWESELGTELFTWVVRNDMKRYGMKLPGAYKLWEGVLTIKGVDGDKPVYIGKPKREWQDFVLEFKIKVSKGKAWFLGHVSVESGEMGENEHLWDKLALEAKNNQWTTFQVRCIKGLYDVMVDGGPWKDVDADESRGKDFGGFGFMVEGSGGECEVREVRVKVLSKKSYGEGGDEGEGEDG